jgi:chromosomal replication initiation ATPase DnaA|tara:strand:- start:3751 stop:4404 length:654 start_codon:yes stop_codon:yes gene_type:complete
LSQLIFKFPFKTNYIKQDFFVSSSNFEAYKLIESWPNWPDKSINVHGPSGCGKTHLSKILANQMETIFINSKNFNEETIVKNKLFKCLIIDNFNNNINEKLLYSMLNHLKQIDKYVLINSLKPINHYEIKLKDLKSRLEGFIKIGISLPTDELLKVVILKIFSEKQIKISEKNVEYIIKNIERTYDKILKFTKEIDNLSLSTGKVININLIKKVLND